jgi:hypothetical protein
MWPTEGQFERARRAEIDWRRDPEAAHGAAYHNMPAPIVNTKVDVSVTLDGRAIAAAVSTRITNDNRTVNSSSGFDGRASWAPPDMP